jgi:O-antigen ligase
LTYGGAVVSLVNPFYGLLIYICFAIVRPTSLWHWSVPPGNYSRIIGIALIAGWLLNGAGNWSFGRARAPLLSLVGFWLWAAICTPVSVDPLLGVEFIEEMGKIVLPVLIGTTLIHNAAQLRQIAWVIVLSKGYVAYDFNVGYYSGFNRLALVGFGGMDNNSYTIGLVTGVGLAFVLGIVESSWWKKLLCFVAAALMAHAVMFSQSRGGMLGLCIVIVASFAVMPKRPGNYALFACGFVLALALAGPSVWERFATSFDPEKRGHSATSRLSTWGVALRMVRDYPITGIGPNHFKVRVSEYPRSDGIQQTFGHVTAHSVWLHTAAELGIPGFVLLFAFYLLILQRLVADLRMNSHAHSEDEAILAASRPVVASLIGFCISAQFVSLVGLEIPYYVGLIGLGALKLNSARAIALADQDHELEHNWIHTAVGPSRTAHYF